MDLGEEIIGRVEQGRDIDGRCRRGILDDVVDLASEPVEEGACDHWSDGVDDESDVIS